MTDGEHPVPEHPARLEDQQEDEGQGEEQPQRVQSQVFVLQLDEVGTFHVARVEGDVRSLCSEWPARSKDLSVGLEI